MDKYEYTSGFRGVVVALGLVNECFELHVGRGKNGVWGGGAGGCHDAVDTTTSSACLHCMLTLAHTGDNHSALLLDFFQGLD